MGETCAVNRTLSFSSGAGPYPFSTLEPFTIHTCARNGGDLRQEAEEGVPGLGAYEMK